MTKAELMDYVGKKVYVYFKDGERGIYGTLGYVDEFSAKYDYRKPNYFFINHTSFKVSHVKKVEELPKGHGRLIDADALIKQLEAMANNRWNMQVGASKGLEEAIDIVDDAPIIEADKEE